MAIDSPDRVISEPTRPKGRWRRAALAVGAVLIIVGATWGAFAAYGMWQTSKWHKANLAVGLVTKPVNDLYGSGAIAWTSSQNGIVYVETIHMEIAVIPPAGVATSHQIVYQGRRVQVTGHALAADSTGLLAIGFMPAPQSSTGTLIGLVRPSQQVDTITSTLALPFDWTRVTALAYSPDDSLYVLALAKRGLNYVTGLLKYVPNTGWTTLSQQVAGCGLCTLAVGTNNSVYIYQPGTMVDGQFINYLGRFTPANGYEPKWDQINLWTDGPFAVDSQGGVALAGMGPLRPGMPKNPQRGAAAQSYATFLRVAADKTHTSWPIVNSSGEPMQPALGLQLGPDQRTFYVIAGTAEQAKQADYQLQSVTLPPN
jgi:hypothetical protein